VVLPPAVVMGDSATDDSATGVSVRTAVLDTPPPEAEIVTGVEMSTPPVVIVNLTLVAPAGTVMVSGMEATDGFELESDTANPPAGAGAFT